MQYDIICFSHLRWNFVYQRPQHLLSRFARQHRVFFIEEPVFTEEGSDHCEVSRQEELNLWTVVPHLAPGLPADGIEERQRILLNGLLESQGIQKYISWYYSPMAYRFSQHLEPQLVVYDCMDELSGFLFAPPALTQTEAALMKRADLVFTGGHTLFQAKKHLHSNIHPFPSSIDKAHFLTARNITTEPDDQGSLPRPRIGFYGVIDERLNIALLGELAEKRPEWQFVLIGPIVKIDPATLPSQKNIHYPGGKDYKDLPRYLAGWDIAMMPFALNASTKFISPTKTPEYLAGGKPVISTSITDVITPYGDMGLVHIADTADEFIAAAEQILHTADDDKKAWLEKVDQYLAGISWDKTWQNMTELIEEGIGRKNNIIQTQKAKAYV